MAGERTVILNVESKLSKILAKPGSVSEKQILDNIFETYADHIDIVKDSYGYDAFYSNILKKEFDTYGIKSEILQGTIPLNPNVISSIKPKFLGRFNHTVVKVGNKVYDPTGISLGRGSVYSVEKFKSDWKTTSILKSLDEKDFIRQLPVRELPSLSGMNTLVVKAAERDKVLGEISARMARYEKFDPVITSELRTLRNNVKDVFNKGLTPSDELMEQLYFLDAETREVLNKMTATYDRVVTPDDFKAVAKIMSEHLAEEVPILKNFTRFLGRLAQDYLQFANPKNSDFNWSSILKTTIRGSKSKGYVLPESISQIFGLPSKKPLSEQFLSRFGVWKPDGTLDEIVNGISSPEDRRTGAKFFKFSISVPTIDLKKAALGKEIKLTEVELFKANKLPKSWTNVPSINFDGKIIEQNFTQNFEEKLVYKNKDGKWITNILQVPQKTEMSVWDQVVNAEGKINDIADATKARTAYAVNSNHSNDATIVKQLHLWGKRNNIPTSSIHDAFLMNTTDMLKGRQALREIYANSLESNTIKKTLDEMLSRGFPKELYQQYLDEAIEIGLIPVVGRSRINGVLMKESDILKKEDILKKVLEGFLSDFGFYGVG